MDGGGQFRTAFGGSWLDLGGISGGGWDRGGEDREGVERINN